MIDTLLYVKKLEAAGVPRLQAEIQVEIMTNFSHDQFATKDDLVKTETRLFAHIDVKIAELSRDLTFRMGAMMIVLIGVQTTITKLLLDSSAHR